MTSGGQTEDRKTFQEETHTKDPRRTEEGGGGESLLSMMGDKVIRGIKK